MTSEDIVQMECLWSLGMEAGRTILYLSYLMILAYEQHRLGRRGAGYRISVLPGTCDVLAYEPRIDNRTYAVMNQHDVFPPATESLGLCQPVIYRHLAGLSACDHGDDLGQ